MITTPESVIAVPDRKTSLLYWPSKRENGEYYMMGGIVWPTAEEGYTEGDVAGFAVLLGLHLLTKVFYVFEEYRFECIDPVSIDNMMFPGASKFFNICWTMYSARTFAQTHPDSLHSKYLRQVYASKMIVPKPIFPGVIIPSEKQGIQTINEYALVGRLKFNEDTKIYKELAALEVRGSLTPASKALAVALIGYEKNPWRQK